MRTADSLGISPSFIDRLTEREREDLTSVGRTIHLRSGGTALIEGQVSGQVLVIVRGRMRVWTTAEDGHESLLAIRRPGDVVGELSALDGRPHSATVSALEPVEARAIAASTFRDYLATHPSAAFAVLELLTERLRDADRKRAEFGSVDAAGRVAARLAELAEQHGEADERGVRIELALSQEELASWVGASREAVSRALRVFRERGWIKTERRCVTVLDLDALRNRGT